MFPRILTILNRDHNRGYQVEGHVLYVLYLLSNIDVMLLVLVLLLLRLCLYVSTVRFPTECKHVLEKRSPFTSYITKATPRVAQAKNTKPQTPNAQP